MNFSPSRHEPRWRETKGLENWGSAAPIARTDRKPPPRGILKPRQQGRSPDSRVTRTGDYMCRPCRVRRLPTGNCPQWPTYAHPLAYRCGGSTGVAATFRPSPVSRFIHRPGSAGGHLAAAAGSGSNCRHYSRSTRHCRPPRRQMMNDLHKRPLLLDASENSPL